MKAASKAGWTGVLAALAAHWVFAQATLPARYTGPWEYSTPPAGWTFTGLGIDYLPGYDGLGDGAAKLDGTGDFIAIHFSSAPGAVTYWVAGNTFSGGTFRVDQSVDGTNWTALQTYTQLAAVATFRTNATSPEARHLRFHYAEKVTGNVGVDDITVAAFVLPEIGSVAVAGRDAAITVPETVVGRTYRLEHADALATNPVAWTPDDVEMGSTNALVFHDLAPSNTVLRYYRVLDATP